MATRKKRQTNYYPDSTTGTINITHGNNHRPGNNGFFGNGFTNTTSSSSKKRRRRRKEAERRRRREAELQAQAAERARAEAQAAAEAHARHQAQLYAEAQARAQAQAEAEAHARAVALAEAKARAERERAIAAHQHALEMLPHSQASAKADLDKKYNEAVATLSTTLASEIQYAPIITELNDHPLLDPILHEKTKINYLISQKSELSKRKELAARSFSDSSPLEITIEQYKAVLGSRSASAEQAHQLHSLWEKAYKDALDANLYQQAVEQLSQRSIVLSDRYAEHTASVQQINDEALAIKHVADANRLWSVVAGPTAPSSEFPSAAKKGKVVAEKLFTRQASKLLGRALPHLALLYPTELGNGELGPSILATAASEIGVSRDVDLDFIASKQGTVNVAHRLTLEDTGGALKTAWTQTNGVTVGTQVRVRSFEYNASTNRYEFTRDGDTKPSLIWTPAAAPENSSTFLPSRSSDISHYPGTALQPVSDIVGDYPTYDTEDIEDLILVFPEESGLKPIYLVFSQRIGDHRYHSKPTHLPAFPEAKQVRGKTRIQGGGKTRPRWKDHTGNIYEWDFRHGTVEKYSKRGVHLGEYNADTGMQTKPADPTRKIEP